MQLFVIPVTTKLLTRPNRAMDIEFPVAQERHIPVLPLMMEHGLDDVFSSRFGDLQYLDPNDTDETRRSFDEVLETYVRSVLVSSELTERVRAAFDAYIFLSYRKKDRKKAQELMRLIHRNPLCRDIAIWYDEFLTPGEDFNQAIGKMLEQSDLFALVVTPNLVNEVNYVMTTEYPAAQKYKKPVLPVEMEKTDRGKLEEFYEALPPCVPGEEDEEFHKALLEKIREIDVTENDKDPDHNFLIGLAYLDGIDVEVDSERALELITGAAEAGVPEAIGHLVMIYERGKGTRRDYREGIRWREKQVALFRGWYEHEPNESCARNLIDKLWDLGDARYELRMLEVAKAAYHEMCIVSDKYAVLGIRRFRRYLSISYEKLGDIARVCGDLLGARKYNEKVLAICEELAAETRTMESRRDLSIGYGKLGDVLRDSGDLLGAREYYGKGLAIFEELAAETGTVESRQDLSISYERLGDIAKASGDLAGAQEYYEKSHSISEELAAETGTVESRRGLSISCNRLGDIAKECGGFARAQEYFEKGHSISEELAAETGTIESRWDLSISYNRLGDIAKACGDFAGAREYYGKCIAISEALAAETGTVELRRDLSISYNRLGDIAKASGDLTGARECYEKSLAIREELAVETGTVESRRDLSIIYNRLGNIAKARGDFTGARKYYEKCIAVFEELVEETGTLQAYRYLAAACFKIGMFYLNDLCNSLDRAREMFERIVEISRECDDEYLAEMGKKAKQILEEYF